MLASSKRRLAAAKRLGETVKSSLCGKAAGALSKPAFETGPGAYILFWLPTVSGSHTAPA